MQTEGVVREQLVATLKAARRLIEDVRAGRRPALGEQNTKAVLIEPVLAALGWDPRDPAEVFREYSQASVPGRVDYALLVEGAPALFVEAKDLGKDLSDRNALTQILRYAWMTRVPCCLLTNGDDYHLYAVRRSQREDDEVALRVRVSDAGEADATAATLALVSKESVREGHLDKCLGSWRVDRRVQPELLDLLKPDSRTLLRYLRRRLPDLSPTDLRESLGRARITVEFGGGPPPPPPPPDGDRYVLRRRFWTELLQRAAKTTDLHRGITPGKENWLGTGAGRGGLSLCYVVREHDAQVELYIDRGKGSEAWNTNVFNEIRRSRESVEEAFGEALEWQPLEGKRACRIRSVIGIGGYRDESKWPEVHEAMIDAMVRFEKALRPRIAELAV